MQVRRVDRSRDVHAGCPETIGESFEEKRQLLGRLILQHRLQDQFERIQPPVLTVHGPLAAYSGVLYVEFPLGVHLSKDCLMYAFLLHHTT